MNRKKPPRSTFTFSSHHEAPLPLPRSARPMSSRARSGAPAWPLAALLQLLLLFSWAVAGAGAAADCMAPALPEGAFHVVIAGWMRRSPDCFQRYLKDMGLTNARAFAYRRTDPHLPPSAPVAASCGATIEERLLLPNHGREAAAFFDWAIEHYDSPPKAVVFLHGHGPFSWHTRCHVVAARTRLAYAHHSDPQTAPLIAQHTVTLTWLDPKMYAPGQDVPRIPLNISSAAADQRKDPAGPLCDALLAKVNVTVPQAAPSCCATFIAPGSAIRRHPKWFWEEMRATAIRPDVSAEVFGRLCFECAFTACVNPRGCSALRARLTEWQSSLLCPPSTTPARVCNEL